MNEHQRNLRDINILIGCYGHRRALTLARSRKDATAYRRAVLQAYGAIAGERMLESVYADLLAEADGLMDAETDEDVAQLDALGDFLVDWESERWEVGE